MHRGEVPTADLKGYVCAIEARKGEERIVGRRKLLCTTNRIIESFDCDWRCKDEGNINVEEDGLILEHLSKELIC